MDKSDRTTYIQAYTGRNDIWRVLFLYINAFQSHSYYKQYVIFHDFPNHIYTDVRRRWSFLHTL